MNFTIKKMGSVYLNFFWKYKIIVSKKNLKLPYTLLEDSLFTYPFVRIRTKNNDIIKNLNKFLMLLFI